MYSTTYLAKEFVGTNLMKNLWKFCCNIEFLYFFNKAFWQNFKSHFNKHKKANIWSKNSSKHNLPRKRIRCHKFNEKSMEILLQHWILVNTFSTQYFDKILSHILRILINTNKQKILPKNSSKHNLPRKRIRCHEVHRTKKSSSLPPSYSCLLEFLFCKP